jgi:hypothetical protein
MKDLFNIVLESLKMKNIVFGDSSFIRNLDSSKFKEIDKFDNFNIYNVKVSQVFFKMTVNEKNTYVVCEVSVHFLRHVKKHEIITPVIFLGFHLYNKKHVFTDFDEILGDLESSDARFEIGHDNFSMIDKRYAIYHVESDTTQEISKTKLKKLQYNKKQIGLNKRRRKTSEKIKNILKK